ncbi:MAG TPA: class I SAM-dependent methyltransferase [Burkholderiales bacterium]|nr:class I SAM-dependent methyltransferase [Burkholderiales bacterium]
MERVPEPELMEDAEQAAAYAAADFSEPHQAFVAHFRRLFPAFRGGRVLDLGCGPADVTIRFARAYPEARLVGVDGAEPMLRLGREALARAGLERRITLVRLRLPDASLAGAGYDAIICNSLLHHLADPQALWQTVAGAARAGAAVLVMDLARPASLEETAALVERHAAGAPPLLQRDFRNSLLAAYRPQEVEAQLRAAGLAHFRVAVVSDRHWLAWGHVREPDH